MLSPDSCGLCVCRPLTGPRLSAVVPAAWWKHWKHDAPHEAEDVQPTRATVRRAKSISRAINTGQGFWSSVRCCWDGHRSQDPSNANNMLVQRMWNLRNRFCSCHSRIIGCFGHFALLLQASQMFRFLPLSSHHSGAELAPRRHPFVWKDLFFLTGRFSPKLNSSPSPNAPGYCAAVGQWSPWQRFRAHRCEWIKFGGDRNRATYQTNRDFVRGYSARVRGKRNKEAFWDGSEGCLVRCSPVLAIKAFIDLFLFISSVFSDSLLVCNVTWRVLSYRLGLKCSHCFIYILQ